MNELVTDPAGWLEHVRRIEHSGIDTLLIRDHIASEPFGPQLAPIATMSTIAAHTVRLRIGSMVLDNDYRHPALVAHEAATIDSLSGGRFELGLGAGWLRSEYLAMGLAFDPPATRIARLEEAVAIIAGLLSGETVTFHGTHYSIDELALPTGSMQRPRPPILIGAGGPKMLALAARHADIVGLLPAPIRRDDDEDDPADRRPAAMDVKLAVLRGAAPERFEHLELSLFATFVITEDRRHETDSLIARMGWTGIEHEDVWEMPSIFVGSLEQIDHDLRDRRQRFGVTYLVTSDRNLDTVARVVEYVSER